MLLIIFTVFVGAMLPTQTAINSKLRSYIISPMLASMVSFSVAEIFLIVLTLVMRINPFISLSFFLSSPKWIWLGGFCGVTALTSIIFLFQKLGSVQTVILPIIGQIFMGLIIDNFGWFGSRTVPTTLGKIIGVLLMIAGAIFVVVLPSVRHKMVNKVKTRIWGWQIYGVIIGMLMASQMAINSKLGRMIGSPLHASLVSFTVGTILLLIIVGIKERGYKNILLGFEKTKPKWIWLGGFLGATYVLGTVSLVPILGNSAVVLLTILGQILVSLIIDHFGLLGAVKNRIVRIQIFGTLIMILGVTFTKLF